MEALQCKIEQDLRERKFIEDAAVYKGECYFENILEEDYIKLPKPTVNSKHNGGDYSSNRSKESNECTEDLEFQREIAKINDDDKDEIKIEIDEFLGGSSAQSNNQNSSITKEKITKNSFEFMKLLGYGTYGRVFLARKKNNGKIYAIKVMDKKNIKKNKQIELTKLERKILKNINSPFLIRLYYAFQSKTKLFLVIEYCPGGEFFYYLKLLRSFHEKTVKFYASNIILGLQALHSQGIVYRDLKPENLLIDHRGYMKLTDFGLAKENVTQNSGCINFCGTVEYIAPEVHKNCGYGLVCDYWSLGCLIYELLESQPPFYHPNQKVMFSKITNLHLYNQTMKYITDRIEEKYGPELCDLIVKLLNKDPTQRLGYNGIEEIMQHPWFDAIDWAQIMTKSIKPPYIPDCSNYGLCNFDEFFINESIEQEYADESDAYVQSPTDNIYSDFTYAQSETDACEIKWE